MKLRKSLNGYLWYLVDKKGFIVKVFISKRLAVEYMYERQK